MPIISTISMLCLRGDHVVNWHGECLHYDGCAVLTD